MEKFYRFAGLELAVCADEALMYVQDRHLAPFRVSAVTDPHRFTFTVVDALTPPASESVFNGGGFRVYEEGSAQVRYMGAVAQSWEQAYMRAEHGGKDHRVQLLQSQFPGRVSTHMVLTALAAERLIAENGGFLLHCSYIIYNNKAILFTAPSGTGKSTQADLWQQLRGAKIVNGDRAAVLLTPQGILAGGIPFAGSSQYCENVTAPLAAIVCLSQAAHTTIRRLKGLEAFRLLWEGISANVWDKPHLEKISAAAGQVATEIPMYYLPCPPDESAVLALEQALKAQV